MKSIIVKLNSMVYMYNKNSLKPNIVFVVFISASSTKVHARQNARE